MSLKESKINWLKAKSDYEWELAYYTSRHGDASMAVHFADQAWETEEEFIALLNKGPTPLEVFQHIGSKMIKQFRGVK